MRLKMFVIVLALLCLLLVGWWLGAHSSPLGGNIQQEAMHVDGEPGSNDGRGAGRDESRHAQSAPSKVDFSEPHNGAEATAVVDSLARIIISYCTASGSPVEQVSLRGKIVREDRDVPGGFSLSSEFGASTDSEGKVVIDGQRTDTIRLDVVDAEWYCPTFTADLAKGTSDTPIRVTLVLSPAKTVRVVAMYDDGQPVTYMGAFKTQGEGEYVATFALSEDGTASIKRVPVDSPLSCTVFAGKRLGYTKHTVTIDLNDLQLDREILVIVPKSEKALGMIRVEFGRVHEGLGDTVMIEQEGGSPRWSQLSGTSDRWKSGQLPPGKRYRVTMFGAECWRSEWVRVEAGVETILLADLKSCAIVRARLLDASGNPISNGVLRIPNGAYMHYFQGSPPVPSGPHDWRSNEAGEIQMMGLPPGDTMIEAEAWGKELVSRPLELQAGGTYDLGDLILDDAVGEIVVQITAKTEKFAYVVMVADEKSVPIYPSVPVVGDTALIRNLPLRNYVIVVTFASGGTAVTKEVALHHGKTSDSIQIDVSSIVP